MNLINNQYWSWKSYKADVAVTLKSAGTISIKYSAKLSDQYADHTTEKSVLLSWFIDLLEAMQLLSGQLTIQKLLKVVDKELSQRRPFWSLQSVKQLLDFGGDTTVDWNTYTIRLAWKGKAGGKWTWQDKYMEWSRWEGIQEYTQKDWEIDEMRRWMREDR